MIGMSIGIYSPTSGHKCRLSAPNLEAQPALISTSVPHKIPNHVQSFRKLSRRQETTANHQPIAVFNNHFSAQYNSLKHSSFRYPRIYRVLHLNSEIPVLHVYTIPEPKLSIRRACSVNKTTRLS